MPKVSRGALGAAAVLFAASVISAGTARADNLLDALTLAYQTNPTLQEERAQLRSTDETYVQARAGYRPNATAKAQASWTWSKYGPNSQSCSLFGVSFCPPGGIGVDTNNLGGTVSLTQPLFTSGKVTAAVNAAEAKVLSAREDLRQTEAQVMLQVIQAYSNVQFDERALDIRKQDTAVLQHQVEEERARFDVGEVTRTDVAQTEAQLAQTQALLSTAQSQLAQDRAAYAAVVGQTPAQLDPAPPFKVFPDTIDEAFDTVEQNNPALRSADYLEQAATAQVAEVKAQRAPNVSFGGDYQYGVPLSPLLQSGAFTRTIDAGVTLQIPIFTGGQLSSQIRQAIEQDNVARTQMELVRRTQLQNLSQAWNQMLGARANKAANKEQVRAATIAFNGTQAEQQVGLRTTLEVLNAEEVLRSAQLQLAQAEHDEYVATAGVLGVMGLLEARNLVPGISEEPGGHSFNQLKHAFGYVPGVEDGVQTLDSIGQRSIKQLPAPVDAPIITGAPEPASAPPAGKP